MMPLAWVIGIGVTSIAGLLRYKQVKVKDIIRVKTEIAPTLVKVTGFSSADIVGGTVVTEIGGIYTDTKVPVTVNRKNIIENVTPRLW